MVVCTCCGREMSCVKNGVSVIFSGGYHIYTGDKFGCSCGNSVIVTNPTPWNPQTPKKPGEHDIVMD